MYTVIALRSVIKLLITKNDLVIQSPTFQKLLYALGTIQVASIEPERIFSICGSFVTKVRSRLEDDTIDALVFLKKYYIRQKDDDISALF